jgi:glycerol-3-phosphate dehydrogenase
MKRETVLKRVKKKVKTWDIVIIGGGATGLGVAVDGASRGYKTLLIEQVDFAKGTSSRSTKLVHGGVRYLQQGDIATGI